MRIPPSILLCVALAAGCGARTFVADGSCEDELEPCDGSCVDTETDAAHCGACGAACETGDACVDGACQGDPPCPPDGCLLECPPNQVDCSGTCVDTAAHADHCGGCDRPCADGARCEGGACTEACECGLCAILALPGQTSGAVQGATSPADGDQSSSSCSSSFAPDVTYSFVAPTAARYVFDTAGTVFDTTLTARRDCAEIVCNDDVDGTVSSRIEIDLVAGDAILVTVDGFSDDAFGDYVLSWRTTSDPCGDPSLTLCDGLCVDTTSDHRYCGSCTSPCGDEEACLDGVCTCVGRCECDQPVCGSCGIDVDLGSGLPAYFEGSTLGAPDDLAPTCSGGGSPEVLHRFVAPFTASYWIRAAAGPQAYDPVLFVLDRATCTELACNDDDGETLDSSLTVRLDEGREVVIVVDGFGGESGDYALSIDVLE